MAEASWCKLQNKQTVEESQDGKNASPRSFCKQGLLAARRLPQSLAKLHSLVVLCLVAAIEPS